MLAFCELRGVSPELEWGVETIRWVSGERIQLLSLGQKMPIKTRKNEQN